MSQRCGTLACLLSNVTSAVSSYWTLSNSGLRWTDSSGSPGYRIMGMSLKSVAVLKESITTRNGGGLRSFLGCGYSLQGTPYGVYALCERDGTRLVVNSNERSSLSEDNSENSYSLQEVLSEIGGDFCSSNVGESSYPIDNDDVYHSVLCPLHKQDEIISLDGCTLQRNYNIPPGFSWGLSPTSCLCNLQWWKYDPLTSKRLNQCTCRDTYLDECSYVSREEYDSYWQPYSDDDSFQFGSDSESAGFDDWTEVGDKVTRRRCFRMKRKHRIGHAKLRSTNVVRSARGYYFARQARKRRAKKGVYRYVPNSGPESIPPPPGGTSLPSAIPGVEWLTSEFSATLPSFDLNRVGEAEMERMERVIVDFWFVCRSMSWGDAALALYKLIVDIEPSYSVVHLQHHIETVLDVVGNFSVTYNDVLVKCKDLSVNMLIDLVGVGMRSWASFVASSLGVFLTVIANYVLVFITNPQGFLDLSIDNIKVFLFRVKTASWNSKDFISWLWEIASDVLNTIKAFKETGSFIEAITRNSPYMRAYEEYMRVVGLYDMYNNGNLELIAKMTEAEYEVLVRETKEALMDQRPLVDSRMRVTLDRAVNDLTAKHNKIIERFGMSGIRIRPFTVLAMGQSKTGKSFLMQKLVPLLLHLNNFKNDEEYVGIVDETDKYNSTFKPFMTALCGDDVCNFINGKISWSEIIIRFVNNHPHVLNKAEISEKGRVWMLIKMFFMTTNVPSLDILANVREHSAVMSRINVAYVQRVKREYQTVAMHEGEEVYGPGLDESKLPDEYYDMHFPDIYEFDVYHIETYASAPVGVKLTFGQAVREHAPDHWRYTIASVNGRELRNVGISELIEYLARLSSTWYRKQAALLANVKAMDRKLGCHACSNALEHCTCDFVCRNCGSPSPLFCTCEMLHDRDGETTTRSSMVRIGSLDYVETGAMVPVETNLRTMMPLHPDMESPGSVVDRVLSAPPTLAEGEEPPEVVAEPTYEPMPLPITLEPIREHAQERYLANAGYVDAVDEFRHNLRDYLFNRVNVTLDESRGVCTGIDGVMQIKSIMLLERLFKRVRARINAFTVLLPFACIDTNDREMAKVLLSNVPIIGTIRTNVSFYNSKVWTMARKVIMASGGLAVLYGMFRSVKDRSLRPLVCNPHWASSIALLLTYAGERYTQKRLVARSVSEVISYHKQCGLAYKIHGWYKRAKDWYYNWYYSDMEGVLDVVVRAKGEILLSDNEYAKTLVRYLPAVSDRVYKVLILKLVVDALRQYRSHLGMVATGGYEVTQEAAIAKAHKYADMSYITAYQSNMDEQPNSADINEGNLLKLLHKQVYKMTMVDSVEPSFVVATAIKSNLLMTVSHGLRHKARYEIIRKPVEYDERGGLITKNAMFRFTFFESSVVARCGDVCVFYCPKVGPVKDLTKFMPTILPTDITHVTAVYRNRMGVVGDDNGHFNYTYKHTTLNVKDYNDKQIWYDGFDYTARFGYIGMSGSPIMTPTNPACIIAMHVGAKDILTGSPLQQEEATVRGWPHSANWIKNIAHVCVEGEHISALQIANSGCLQSDLYGKRSVVHGVSPKSIMYRMEPGEYMQYGRSPALVTFNDLDGVRPTLLAPHLEEYCGLTTKWDSPRLRGPDGNDNQAKWLNSVKYSTHTSDMIPMDAIDWAVNDYLQPLLAIASNVDKHEYRILDRVEVINGREGSRYMSSMTMSTSTGPPLNAPKNRYATQFPTETGLKWAWTTDMFDKEADRMESEYIKGNSTYPVFGVFPKIEPTITTKSKVRLVQSAPIALQIVARKYLLPIIAFLCEYRYTSENMLGINPYCDEWKEMYEHVSQFGEDRMGAMDYSKYDLRISAQVTIACYRVFYEIARELGFGPDALAVIVGLATDMCYPVLDVAGEILQMRGMGPSGSNDTTARNGTGNSIYNRVWYFISHQRKYARVPRLLVPKLEAFRLLVALITYGDDNGFGVSRRCKWFTMQIAANIAAEFDVVLTPANKESAVTDFVGKEDLANGFFLKRGFRHENGRVFAPLDELSIFKRLYAVNKPRPPNTVALITMDNIESALDEWSLHGEQVYETRRSQIENLLSDNNLFVNRIKGLRHSYEDKLLVWKKRTEQSGFRVENPYYLPCDDAEG